MTTKQYRDAIEILEGHIKILEAMPDKNRDKLHVCYYDLGFLYEVNGDFDKAEGF